MSERKLCTKKCSAGIIRIKKDRELLRGFLGRWVGERGHSLEISEFPSAESFLFSYAQEGNFHILLLDIEMGAMDGVAMAKKLRRDNDMVQIVFVTGYSDRSEERRVGKECRL